MPYFQGMDGHVVVCGLSGVAVRVVEQLLSSGEAVVLVVPVVDAGVAAARDRWQVPVVATALGVRDALQQAQAPAAQAVVCVSDDERWNLEIALLADQLAPGVRIVTQLSNETLSTAMSDGPGDHQVLDLAALATPSVVQACLADSRHEVGIEDTSFVIAQFPVDVDTSLRARYGDLAPVAVIDAEGDVTACPGRDHIVREGQIAVLLGTPTEFTARGLDAVSVDPPRPAASRTPLHRRALGGVETFLRDANPNLFRLWAVLAALLCVSTLILWWGYQRPGMSALDALYFSTETVATVGYGDFNFANQPPWLRIWSIMLMFAGLTTTGMIMAFLAEVLISRRLSDGAGRTRARQLSGHVIVVGLGAFGMSVARELRRRGEQVVVVERAGQTRFSSTATGLDIPIIYGDAALPETMAAAGLSRAAAVAVVTSNDLTNIEVGIAVRTLLGPRWGAGGGVPVVLRIFDRDLAGSVVHRFGFQNVRPTVELAVPWFIGAALGLQVLGTFSVRSESFMVGALAVAPGGGLDSVAMHQLSGRTRVIAIRRADGTLEHPPRRGTSFAAGDLAYLVGPYAELLAVLDHERVRAPT